MIRCSSLRPTREPPEPCLLFQRFATSLWPGLQLSSCWGKSSPILTYGPDHSPITGLKRRCSLLTCSLRWTLFWARKCDPPERYWEWLIPSGLPTSRPWRLRRTRFPPRGQSSSRYLRWTDRQCWRWPDSFTVWVLSSGQPMELIDSWLNKVSSQNPF